MNDYFEKAGKGTGSDGRAKFKRAVKLFEDRCLEVKTRAVPAIPLQPWDDPYEFGRDSRDTGDAPA